MTVIERWLWKRARGSLSVGPSPHKNLVRWSTPCGLSAQYLPMTERRPSKAQLERRPERLRRDYQAVKARLTEVGFTCEGSLTELYTSCGNPNCRCADPEHRHGPYWQLTWKEQGGTSPAGCQPRTPPSTSSGSQTAASRKPPWKRCATSPAKPASRSSPPAAVPTTAPSAPATRPAQPARRRAPNGCRWAAAAAESRWAWPRVKAGVGGVVGDAGVGGRAGQPVWGVSGRGGLPAPPGLARPSRARRARLTAAARRAKSAATLGLPRTRARRPPWRWRIRRAICARPWGGWRCSRPSTWGRVARGPGEPLL